MLALTMGDPSGIGGEITLGAWQALRNAGPAFVLLADPDWIAGIAGSVPVRRVATVAEAGPVFAEALPVLALPDAAGLAMPPIPGRPDPANAAAITGSIAEAVRLAQVAGLVEGVVTNPISKAVLKQAGFAHPGHTEFLAALTGSPAAR